MKGQHKKTFSTFCLTVDGWMDAHEEIWSEIFREWRQKYARNNVTTFTFVVVMEIIKIISNSSIFHTERGTNMAQIKFTIKFLWLLHFASHLVLLTSPLSLFNNPSACMPIAYSISVFPYTSALSTIWCFHLIYLFLLNFRLSYTYDCSFATRMRVQEKVNQRSKEAKK